MKLVRAVKKANLLLTCRLPVIFGSRPQSASLKHAGFNLLELLILLSLVGVLAAVAYPSYTQHIDRARNGIAASDIMSISQAIERFYTAFSRFPNSLAEVGLSGMLDPWDKPYQYLRIHGAELNGKSELRKDKSLVPVNSDFDLYSMGKDGSSMAPFTAKVSHDDIVRANNGSYIGPAAAY